MKTPNLIITIALLALYSCGEKAQQSASDRDNNISNDSMVALTHEQAATAKIEMGAVEKREISIEVRTNGYFDVPPQNKARVSTLKPGYIKKTTLLIGDQVKKGQTLVVLESPEFVKVQQSFMELKGQMDYLKSEFERKKILEQENITAKKNLLKAEADYKTSLAKYQGLKKELELIGINPEKMEFGSYVSNITVTAPIGGTITKVNATIGKYVFPEEVMFEIVNTDHLHVELGVFEKDILKVKEGQQIELRIPSSNGQVYQGEIYLVGKALDEESRTVNVHAHVEEGQAEFLPGMYVEAKILLESRNVQVVPEEAIVSGQDGQFIFIKASEDKDVYQKIPIETGIKSEQWVEITTMDATYADHPVVVKGVYYLISNTSGI